MEGASNQHTVAANPFSRTQSFYENVVDTSSMERKRDFKIEMYAQCYKRHRIFLSKERDKYGNDGIPQLDDEVTDLLLPCLVHQLLCFNASQLRHHLQVHSEG
jgi:hypothetical protein